MNRTYLFGIAIFIAVLGLALLGNEHRAVAGDACARRLVRRRLALLLLVLRPLVSRRPAARIAPIMYGPAGLEAASLKLAARRPANRPHVSRRLANRHPVLRPLASRRPVARITLIVCGLAGPRLASPRLATRRPVNRQPASPQPVIRVVVTFGPAGLEAASLKLAARRPVNQRPAHRPGPQRKHPQRQLPHRLHRLLPLRRPLEPSDWAWIV